MTRRATKARQGIAVATALTLLAFVAVVLAALGTGIGIEARRTRVAAEQAQLRQLLHAGAVTAMDDSLSDGVIDVALPDPFSGAARLRIEIAHPSPEVRSAAIDASIGAHQARQVVRLARSEKGWSILAASLDPPS